MPCSRLLGLLLALTACGPGVAVPEDDTFDPAIDCPVFVEIGTSLDPGQTCARAPSGQVRCWGSVHLSEPIFGDDEPAWQAPWLELEFDSLSVDQDVCGVVPGGLVACRNPAEAFDWSATGGPIVPGTFELAGPVAQVSVGTLGACARLDDGGLQCWGAVPGVETDELLGDDDPPSTVILPTAVTGVSVGVSSACAVLDGGETRCWGYGGDCVADPDFCGWLGVPGVDSSLMPVVVELPLPAVEVSVGATAACVRFADGSFTCWGRSYLLGRLGDEIIGDDETPASLPPLAFEVPVVTIDVGTGGACALLADGSVRCWGAAAIANPLDVGGENVADALTVDPIPLPESAKAVAVGWESACALGDSGAIYCWGGVDQGVLGYGHSDVIGYDPSITEVQPVPVLDPRCDE